MTYLMHAVVLIVSLEPTRIVVYNGNILLGIGPVQYEKDHSTVEEIDKQKDFVNGSIRSASE